MKKSILIVEDEAIIAMALQKMLKHNGYHVLPIASKANEAVSIAMEYNPDMILMDIVLKGEGDGIEAAREILKDHPAPVIFLTGNPIDLENIKFNKKYPFIILSKPPTDEKLLAVIKDMLNN